MRGAGLTPESGQHGRRGPYSGAGPGLTIRAADLGGRHPVDVETAGGSIRRVGRAGAAPARGLVIDAAGSALLPGLHDHHVHLRAVAATLRSVAVGPPDVDGPAPFRSALRRGRDEAVGGGRSWVRAVGYHESVAGPLDRAALDAVIDDVPVRVQDRSGALWVVNSRGISALGLADADEPGIERDGAGRPTGRLFRMDAWLRGRTGEDREEDLGAEVARVSREAAARGVTGLTDATPGLTPAELEWWGRVAADHLLQRLTLMWSPDRGLGDPPPGVQAGPVKVLLDDVDLPVPDELAGWIDDAHRTGRPVAVHCVTRAQTVVAVAALAGAGSVAGDRIEHGSLIPAEILPELARLGITVVTNPSLIHDRGDRYLEDVDPADRGDLYRCASLIEAGVAVGAGTDAPFGSADPWVSVRAAASRRTAGGEVLGPGEAVSAWRALTLFTGRPDAPSTPRRVAAGEPADLVVLDRPLSELAGLTGGEVRTDLGLLSADRVRATVVAGRVVYERAITA